MDILDEKNLNEDEDERASCFLASPSKTYIDLNIGENDGAYANFTLNNIGLNWIYKNSAVWELQAFSLDATRVSNTLEIKHQSIGRNVSSKNLKFAGINIGQDNPLFCYFDITFFNKQGYAIYGAHHDNIASLHTNGCIKSGDISVFEKKKSVASKLDLNLVGGVRVTFRDYFKICRC